jgi:hypothetical protein
MNIEKQQNQLFTEEFIDELVKQGKLEQKCEIPIEYNITRDDIDVIWEGITPGVCGTKILRDPRSGWKINHRQAGYLQSEDNGNWTIKQEFVPDGQHEYILEIPTIGEILKYVVDTANGGTIKGNKQGFSFKLDPKHPLEFMQSPLKFSTEMKRFQKGNRTLYDLLEENELQLTDTAYRTKDADSANIVIGTMLYKIGIPFKNQKLDFDMRLPHAVTLAHYLTQIRSQAYSNANG